MSRASKPAGGDPGDSGQRPDTELSVLSELSRIKTNLKPPNVH